MNCSLSFAIYHWLTRFRFARCIVLNMQIEISKWNEFEFILTIAAVRRREKRFVNFKHHAKVPTASDSEVKILLCDECSFSVFETWKIDMKTVKNLFGVRRRSSAFLDGDAIHFPFLIAHFPFFCSIFNEVSRDLLLLKLTITFALKSESMEKLKASGIGITQANMKIDFWIFYDLRDGITKGYKKWEILCPCSNWINNN